MSKILTLSHSIDNISEDKTDSLPSVRDPPTFLYTGVITWSLVTEEADEIFQEFDIYFLHYAARMGFQSSGTRCFSDIKMLFIRNGKKNTTRNCIQRTDFPIYLRLALRFYLIKICYERGK